ncbi:MAG: AAA family ATPase [Nitrospirales bacterium]|nr:AAA family ATPase [Nitrospirales bacterium]
MADTDSHTQSINWNALDEDSLSAPEASTPPSHEDKQEQDDTATDRRPDQPGKVIGFAGVKGGLGTTTVALNLAMTIVQAGHRVIYLELSSHPGTVASYLNLTPGSSDQLSEIEFSSMNDASLSKSLVRHGSGLETVFFSLWSKIHRSYISSEFLKFLFRELTPRADYLIVDFPLESSPITWCILEHCHLMNVILDTDRVCLETAHDQISFLTKELPVPIYLTVVNRTGMPPTDGLKGIQAQLGCQAVALISSATELCFTAVTKNLPIVCNNPNSVPALQFFQMRDHILAYLTGDTTSLQQDRRAKDRRKQNRRTNKDGW